MRYCILSSTLIPIALIPVYRLLFTVYSMSNFDLSAFFAQFREETEDNIRLLTSGLLNLESHPTDRTTLDGVFRAAHTIKGSARMLGQNDTARLSHAMESLLDDLRSGTLLFNSDHNDVLLACADVLQTLSRNVSEPPPTDSRVDQLIQRLDVVRKQPSATSATPATPLKPDPQPSTPSMPERVPEPTPSASKPESEARATRTSASPTPEPVLPPISLNPVIRPTVRVPITRLDRLLNTVGELVITSQQTSIQQETLEGVQGLLQKQERTIGKFMSQFKRLPLRFQQQINFIEAQQSLQQVLKQTHSMIRQLSENLATHSTVVDGLVNELEAEVMATRLQPIAGLFAPVPRAVRELARSLGKEVRLVTEGETTEADRKVIETMSEPLLHLVRNALDHGIGTPAERTAAGKPAEATLRLAARSLGGIIEITVSDDGRGIDPEAIRSAAIKRNIIDADAARRLRDDEMLELIWQAGFSTSAIITDVSGRGVGMDIVRTAVADIGGHVSVDSELGVGTTFTLTLPITLLTTRVMLVDVSGTLYAIPSTACIGGRRVRTEDIHTLEGRPTVRLNDRNVAIVALATLIDQQGPLPNPSAISHLLVIGPANRPLALLVDRLFDEREVVVKSLGALLGQQRLCTGAMTLADGSLVLVLHPAAIIDRAREIGRPLQASQMTQRAPARLLVVEDSFTTRELLRSMLQSVGYTVETAINGRDALDKLAIHSYDLIVSDVEMPYINGFELTRQVRANQRTADVPVIIITSLAREADRREGLLAGAQAYIVKSQFDQSTLLDTIQQLLGR